MNNIAAIGIDLGGTRVKAVAVDHSGKILKEKYTPTSDDNDQGWKSAVKESFENFQLSKDNLIPVGISAPGLPDENNSCISVMPGRLQGLENLDWSAFLGTKAWVLNDANAAMAAELKFGAATGKKNVVLLTLGTGVGGSIAIDGKIFQGAFQKAGHIGHMSIDSEGPADIVGIPGSLEDAIGNCTIQQRSGGKFSSTHELLEAYRKNDPLAATVWISSVKKLAVCIASITNILSPELVILGGGITEAGPELFEPLEKYMAAFEWRAGGNKTTIVKAHFRDLAGAVGAAGFALLKEDAIIK